MLGKHLESDIMILVIFLDYNISTWASR
jgi:hypothetical protein